MFNVFKKAAERQIYIPFKQGDPTSFQTYFGQESIKRRLKLRIAAMSVNDQLKALFYAPFGYGKTALARTLASEMFREGLIDHYIETIGMNFSSKADVDSFILKLKPYTLIFIDEIHTLAAGARESFYSAIQDNVHVFHRQQRMVKLPVGISWIGATTELGQVHPSLQRRLIPVALEPLNNNELAFIATTQRTPTDKGAASLMAERCSTPWEIKDELYATAEDIVISRQLPKITKTEVEESCDILGIDTQGLRPHERRVLETLFKSPKIIGGDQTYAMARTPLIAISGIDSETFNNHVEPKLLKLGLMKVSSVGRELTGKSLDLYFNESNPNS